MASELRAVNSDDVTGQHERLVDRTVELVGVFVEGRADRAAAVEVDHAWIEYTGFDPDNGESEPAVVDNTGLQALCIAVVWELPGRCEEHYAADTFGQAAAVYSDWDVPARISRMLLRFIRYTQEPSLDA